MLFVNNLYTGAKVIDKLKNELAHANALLGRDSTNTNIPTSQTPAGKEKRRPNSRGKSGKPKGGQPGHEKHSLKEPDESEITDTVEYGSDIDDFECPSCGSGLYISTGKSEVKYEYEVTIGVKKIKHIFYGYECFDCGEIFQVRCPDGLRGDV